MGCMVFSHTAIELLKRDSGTNPEKPRSRANESRSPAPPPRPLKRKKTGVDDGNDDGADEVSDANPSHQPEADTNFSKPLPLNLGDFLNLLDGLPEKNGTLVYFRISFDVFIAPFCSRTLTTDARAL